MDTQIFDSLQSPVEIEIKGDPGEEVVTLSYKWEDVPTRFPIVSISWKSKDERYSVIKVESPTLSQSRFNDAVPLFQVSSAIASCFEEFLEDPENCWQLLIDELDRSQAEDIIDELFWDK